MKLSRRRQLFPPHRFHYKAASALKRTHCAGIGERACQAGSSGAERGSSQWGRACPCVWTWLGTGVCLAMRHNLLTWWVVVSSSRKHPAWGPRVLSSDPALSTIIVHSRVSGFCGECWREFLPHPNPLSIMHLNFTTSASASLQMQTQITVFFIFIFLPASRIKLCLFYYWYHCGYEHICVTFSVLYV